MKSAALAKLRILEDRHKRGAASAYDIALLYTGLGEKDQAFEWLQQAYVDRVGGLLQIKADLMFDPIRSDQRFDDLARGIGVRQ